MAEWLPTVPPRVMVVRLVGVAPVAGATREQAQQLRVVRTVRPMAFGAAGVIVPDLEIVFEYEGTGLIRMACYALLLCRPNFLTGCLAGMHVVTIAAA